MCKKDRVFQAAFKGVDLSKNRFNLIAVIEKGGKIISVGQNDMHKTHPVYFNGEYDKGVHAEYDAIRKASDCEGANMYVFRFKRSGGLGNSKPCENCMKVIKASGISRVYYYLNGKLEKMTI